LSILKVSVIVCGYNEEKDLPSCLHSLRIQTYPSYEVVVVDDGSIDATSKIAASYGTKVICIKHSGLATARNVGVRHSTGEILAFLDGHCVVDKDWIRNIVDCFNSGKKVGMVGGPYLTPEDAHFIDKCIWYAYCSVLGSGGMNSPRTRRTSQSIYLPSGCNMAIRREVLDVVGPFLDNTLVGSEDLDIGCRIVKAGYEVVYSPKVRVWHKGADSFGKFFRQIYSYGKARPMIESTHKELSSSTTLLPSLFLIGLIILSVLSLYATLFLQILLLVLSTYMGVLLIISAFVAWREKKVDYLLGVLVAIIIQHMAYGLGYISGILRRLRGK
jgi:cellulose synthase/poly-beta-1,6-N-acetylglucosamine synthase-like glycosyltransferase